MGRCSAPGSSAHAPSLMISLVFGGSAGWKDLVDCCGVRLCAAGRATCAAAATNAAAHARGIDTLTKLFQHRLSCRRGCGRSACLHLLHVTSVPFACGTPPKASHLSWGRVLHCRGAGCNFTLCMMQHTAADPARAVSAAARACCVHHTSTVQQGVCALHSRLAPFSAQLISDLHACSPAWRIDS